MQSYQDFTLAKMIRFTIILLICYWAIAEALYLTSTEIQEWENFKKMYGRIYQNGDEEEYRQQVYVNNLKYVNEHNKLYEKGETTYTLKINKFADLTSEEFVRTKTGFKWENQNSNASIYTPEESETLPTWVDWRTKGAVTGIKDQGQCRSCWAFSATGCLEGQTFLKTGKLVSLSEQNLIDCSKQYGNNGCDGGLMDAAFQYIQDNKGIDTEESYPYEALEGQCRFKKEDVGAQIKDYKMITSGRESDLQSAVAKVGPISVAIDAEDSMRFYSSGIFYEEDCSSQFLNHGVLVVGYGSNDEGDYWIVKNSWGEEWGNKGYILMSRNKNNNCGIASSAVYPTL